ncbi:UNVERIFIED_CONTAM: hypothetical protein IGO34_22780 [Salmonella enterica subsp. enterica serovar Weltevreden]
MNEEMQRELRVAIAVARARGIDYGTATPAKRSSCHAIAQAAMPGVNALIAEAEAAVRAGVDLEVRKAARKAYDDGFDDGTANSYNNRWKDEEEPQWDMDTLLG